MDIYNVVSFSGIFVLLAIAWLFSAQRRNMNWRLIGCGVGLQLLVGLFIFVVPAGARVFLAVNDAAVSVIESAGAGARFVFGRLALGPGQVNDSGEESLGFILAFQGFPTIIFADGTGKTVHRVPGYLPAGQFLAQMRVGLQTAGVDPNEPEVNPNEPERSGAS